MIYGDTFDDINNLEEGLKAQLLPKVHCLKEKFEETLTTLAPIKRYNLSLDSENLNESALAELLR